MYILFHLLVGCNLQDYISTMIKILKASSARKMSIKHPEFKQ